MSTEPESVMLRLLRDMRAELADMRGEMVTKSDIAGLGDELKSDMHSLRADVASEIMAARKELGEQIAGLRRTVVDYHATAVGRGILISDLEARGRRVERHLNLDAPESH